MIYLRINCFFIVIILDKSLKFTFNSFMNSSFGDLCFLCLWSRNPQEKKCLQGNRQLSEKSTPWKCSGVTWSSINCYIVPCVKFLSSHQPTWYQWQLISAYKIISVNHHLFLIKVTGVERWIISQQPLGRRKCFTLSRSAHHYRAVK